MSLQLLMIDTLRIFPQWLLRAFVGPAPLIDVNTLYINMHVLATLSAKGNKRRAAQSLEDIRAKAAEFEGLNLPLARGVTVEDTSFELLGNTLSARIHRPQNAPENMPAILFFHQGGMVIMDHLTDNHFCSLLAARCGAAVIALDYRLCPENPFPAPIEDAKALWCFVQDNAADLGVDPARVALAGDSAGGLMSSTLALILRDEGGRQPKALCLAYPWVTTNSQNQHSMTSCANTFPLTQETMHFFNAHVFPNDENIDHDWVNPLHAETLEGLPPTVIGTAGFDPIRDQGNAFAERLEQSGNTVIHHCFTELTHSYLMFGRVSNNVEAACVRLAEDLAQLMAMDQEQVE
jgi:acetyl esterase